MCVCDLRAAFAAINNALNTAGCREGGCAAHRALHSCIESIVAWPGTGTGEAQGQGQGAWLMPQLLPCRQLRPVTFICSVHFAGSCFESASGTGRPCLLLLHCCLWLIADGTDSTSNDYNNN